MVTFNCWKREEGSGKSETGTDCLRFPFPFSPFPLFGIDARHSSTGGAHARRSSHRTSYTPPGSTRSRVKTWVMETSR